MRNGESHRTLLFLEGDGGTRCVMGNLKVVYGNEYRVMINYFSKFYVMKAKDSLINNIATYLL